MTTTRPVRVALSIQPQHASYATIRRVVAEAEELGVDVVSIWDHFFSLFGDPAGRHFEAWTALAAWAEQTGRVELAPLVSPVGFRNPDLLADMARTVDHISAQQGTGRLVLGLGGGWFERDYAEYGYDFATTGSRLSDLEQALPRIRARWSRVNPAPTRPIPILIGGGGEKRTLRLVARHADIWHCIAELDDLRRKQQVLDDWCRVEGRDPADIERATTSGAPTSRHTPSYELPPDERGPQLLAMGFTLFNVRSGGPDFPLGPLRAWLAWRDGVNRGLS